MFVYQDLHGKPLDYRDYGYLSVVDFISSMPDTVKIERPSPRGDWLLYDARITPPKHTHGTFILYPFPRQEPII